MRKKKVVGSDVVHREYIAKLYEKLNNKLEKRYKKGSILKKTTVEDIELPVRRAKEDYEAIGNLVIAKVESLLSAKLPYQDRAAIIMRQAEYVFDRPMFNKERGYILSYEYEKYFGRYDSPYIAARFVGEWGQQRYLTRDRGGNYVEFAKKREHLGALIGFSRSSFINSRSRPSSIVPPIWRIVYPMSPMPKGGVEFDSDYAKSAEISCEFPPGTTIEEMERILRL